MAISTRPDRKSTRLNSSHRSTSYAVFCLKKKRRRRQLLEDVPHPAAEAAQQLILLTAQPPLRKDQHAAAGKQPADRVLHFGRLPPKPGFLTLYPFATLFR